MKAWPTAHREDQGMRRIAAQAKRQAVHRDLHLGDGRHRIHDHDRGMIGNLLKSETEAKCLLKTVSRVPTTLSLTTMSSLS